MGVEPTFRRALYHGTEVGAHGRPFSGFTGHSVWVETICSWVEAHPTPWLVSKQQLRP